MRVVNKNLLHCFIFYSPIKTAEQKKGECKGKTGGGSSYSMDQVHPPANHAPAARRRRRCKRKRNSVPAWQKVKALTPHDLTRRSVRARRRFVWTTANKKAAEPPEPRTTMHTRKNPSAKACKGPFADTVLVDVEQYHKMREEKVKATGDYAKLHEAAWRWMLFIQKYKRKDGTWVDPSQLDGAKERIVSTQRGIITSYFSKSARDTDIHRHLIAACRVEVWGAPDTHQQQQKIDLLNSSHSCGNGHCCDKQHLTRHRFLTICEHCGKQWPCVSRVDRHFKEMETVQNCTPCYKRRNHLHEWLVRVQAAERKPVPEHVLHSVREQFQQWDIPTERANYTLVRRFLRRTGFQRFFEHIPAIGKPPPVIAKEKVTLMKRIFDAIQVPFEKHKPPNRKNFLSYSYVLYKVCELLSLDDVLPFFPLLKSRANLIKADKVWKGICSECDYEFIPTT